MWSGAGISVVMVKIVQKKVYILQKKVQMIITEKGIQNRGQTAD